MKKSTKRAISFIVAFALFIAIIPSLVEAKTFPDVTSTDWFYSDVNELSTLGFINGRTDGTFDPTANITRAEYVAIMNRAFPEALNNSNTASPSPTITKTPAPTGVPSPTQTPIATLLPSSTPAASSIPSPTITSTPLPASPTITPATSPLPSPTKTSTPSSPTAAPITFTDVSASDWFYQDIISSAAAGLINGYGTYFSPNNPITRQEAAVVTYNYLNKVLGGNFNKLANRTDSKTIQTSDIASWALADVNMLFNKGIINGYEDNGFRPLNNITRAESAAIANRTYKGVNVVTPTPAVSLSPSPIKTITPAPSVSPTASPSPSASPSPTCDPNEPEPVPGSKPIIYLYPTTQTEVNVELGYPNQLTATYPKYENGWDVLAQPNGDLTDLKTGRSLYSLYWEGGNIQTTIDEGFCVKSEDAITFLEEKLATLGLTEREANEFIIYWLPIMQQNAYNYVKFLPQSEIDQIMPLTITPTPDNIIRVLMVFQGGNKPINIPEQQLTPVTRHGFSVVEWGGTQLNGTIK